MAIGLIGGCKNNGTTSTSGIKEVPAACQEQDKKVTALKDELAAITTVVGGQPNASTSSTDRPGVISEVECRKGDGIMRGDQCTCDSGEVMDPAKGEFCNNGQWVAGMTNLPAGGYFNRKTCLQSSGEYLADKNGCKCAKDEIIYNTFDMRQWCAAGRPAVTGGTTPAVKADDPDLRPLSLTGDMNDALNLELEMDDPVGFSLTTPRTKEIIQKELDEATALLANCIKVNSGTAGQTATPADAAGCTSSGGSLINGTCYCSNGVPVFKIRNKTCTEFMAAQIPGCNDKGGAVVWDDNICRCADYEPANPRGSCTNPFKLPTAATAGSQTSAPGGVLGSCVVYEIATKIVQQTCFPFQDQSGCDANFNMFYEKLAPGKYGKELVGGVGCVEARPQVEVKLKGQPAGNTTVNSTSGTASNTVGTAGTVAVSKCICGVYKQKIPQSDKVNRLCLVARKNDNSTWSIIRRLSMDSDCKAQCDKADGDAVKDLKSDACTK